MSNLYIHFCSKCMKAYSHPDKIADETCPHCHEILLFSGLTKSDWESLNEERKEEYKAYFMLTRLAGYELIISSTPSLEGYSIKQYIDLVFGEIVIPNGLLGAFTSGTYSTISALDKARKSAVELLKEQAIRLGANAIVGFNIAIQDLSGKGMMVSASGTAVVVEGFE